MSKHELAIGWEYKLTPGVVLATLDGEYRTNAVVVEDGSTELTILTDFGNLVKMSPDEVKNNYVISQNYLDALSIGYPVDNLEERILGQIELLNQALQYVNGGSDDKVVCNRKYEG